MKIIGGYVLATLVLLFAWTVRGFDLSKQETVDDGQAKLASFEDLAYSRLAQNARIQGVVVVKADLDGKGNVVGASALSGPTPLISDCLSNVKKWKFKPRSQKSAVVVYEFKLDDGACHDASHSLFRLVYQNFATITACSPVVVSG